MAEIIKLKNGIMKGVEVKVGSSRVALRVIGRMLNGSEIRRFEAVRHNNHAARVLTRSSFYTGTASGEPVLFCT